MLDVIKELIPLLEGAKNGAIWLIAAYFSMSMIKFGIVSVIAFFIVKSAARLLERSMSGKVKDSVYRIECDEWVTLCEGEDLKDLLGAVYQGVLASGSRSGYIHTSDIMRAAKILRQHAKAQND